MRKLIVLAVIFLYGLSTSAQQQGIYARQWEEIDSLIVLKNLPKTALEKVNALYADAKAKGLHDEVIKALLYRLSFEEKIKDKDINKQTEILSIEIENTNDTVSKAILLALLANGLDDYYRQNFWKNRERKETCIKKLI